MTKKLMSFLIRQRLKANKHAQRTVQRDKHQQPGAPEYTKGFWQGALLCLRTERRELGGLHWKLTHY